MGDGKGFLRGPAPWELLECKRGSEEGYGVPGGCKGVLREIWAGELLESMAVRERREAGERFLGRLRGGLPGPSVAGGSRQSVGRISGDRISGDT